MGIYNSTRAIVWGTFQLPVGTSNRKLAVMEVLSSFFDSSNLEATKTIFVRVCLYTRAWEAKIFKSLWRLPWSKYRKRRKVLTLQNCTLFSSSIFLTSGSDILNFRFTKNSQFPVLRFRPEVEKYPIQWPRLSCIYPQSFMKVGKPV